MEHRSNWNLESPSPNQNTVVPKPKTPPKSWVRLLSFLLTVLISVGGTLLFTVVLKNPSASTKLDEINALVSKYYDGEIDREEMDEVLATAYMYALGDKYGFYKNKEETLGVIDSFEGNAAGIGVTVAYDEGAKGLYIFRIDEGSPADKAKMQVGDIIIAVDEKNVADLGYEESVAAIKREKGDTVSLTLLRGNKEIKLEAVYDDFTRQSVYFEKIGDVGYVCFTGFNDATVEQFNNILTELSDKKVKGVIFDVRDNGGGTVDSVCAILDRLVGECDLMTVEYADGSKEVSYTSDSEEVMLPMAVLVNSNTASAAELFAATLSDMKKAPLIGNKTYGKGVVQRTFYLSDDSCVRFTIGKFFPAGGECFNEVGLKPDHNVEYTAEEAKNSYKLGKKDPYIVKALECIK